VSLRIERDGVLARVRLDKPRANAMDAVLVDELTRAAAELRADDGVRGVLLCSAHPRVFCPGLDLVALDTYDAPALGDFLLRFAEMVWELYGLTKPVVAAVAGHAVAGGCILALTADLRIVARGAQMGLNEVKIGVPLPWTVTVLLRASLPPTSVAEVALDGRNFADEDAVRIGLAHAVQPAEGFEAAAVEALARLAERDPLATGATKRQLRAPFLEEMKARESAHLDEFVTAWFSEATRQRRREILASLRGKS
jgi:enoyl-CoA hydratase/carnithine racemase